MAQKIMYFQNSEKIIEAGANEKRMYIILDGVVAISLANKTERLEVARLKKGDFFGEISLFNNTPRTATATAVGGVKLFYIDDVDQLKDFLIRNPAFAAKMVHILARRMAQTDEILVGKISEIQRLKITRDI